MYYIKCSILEIPNTDRCPTNDALKADEFPVNTNANSRFECHLSMNRIFFQSHHVLPVRFPSVAQCGAYKIN